MKDTEEEQTFRVPDDEATDVAIGIEDAREMGIDNTLRETIHEPVPVDPGLFVRRLLYVAEILVHMRPYLLVFATALFTSGVDFACNVTTYDPHRCQGVGLGLTAALLSVLIFVDLVVNCAASRYGRGGHGHERCVDSGLSVFLLLVISIIVFFSVMTYSNCPKNSSVRCSLIQDVLQRAGL